MKILSLGIDTLFIALYLIAGIGFSASKNICDSVNPLYCYGLYETVVLAIIVLNMYMYLAEKGKTWGYGRLISMKVAVYLLPIALLLVRYLYYAA